MLILGDFQIQTLRMFKLTMSKSYSKAFRDEDISFKIERIEELLSSMILIKKYVI